LPVLMDENTSSGGTRYEAHKGYFHGLIAQGGSAYGVPYALELVEDVVESFDGLLAVGGRFAYPNEWYIHGLTANSPPSLRFQMERAAMSGFISAGKPVLGICAGMQMLACLNGCRLTPDIAQLQSSALPHDQRGTMHRVTIHEGTLLRRIIDKPSITVNTFHREAVATVGEGITISAHAEDGIIEAVELPSHHFALGIQWHQELHLDASGQPYFCSLCRGMPELDIIAAAAAETRDRPQTGNLFITAQAIAVSPALALADVFGLGPAVKTPVAIGQEESSSVNAEAA
jgi:putative glutamine amidotransferase